MSSSASLRGMKPAEYARNVEAAVANKARRA